MASAMARPISLDVYTDRGEFMLTKVYHSYSFQTYSKGILLLALFGLVVIAMASAVSLDAEGDVGGGDEVNGIAKRMSRQQAMVCLNRCKSSFQTCGRDRRGGNKRDLFLRCCMGSSGFIQCGSNCGATSIRYSIDILIINCRLWN